MSKNKNHYVAKYSQDLLDCVKNFYTTPTVEKIQQLLEAKADPNAVDEQGNSVLKKAIQNNMISVDDINSLLEAKADPNARDNNQQTSLHITLEPNVGLNRKTQLVKMFMQYNANPDAKNVLGYTPREQIKSRGMGILNKNDPVVKMFNDMIFPEEIKKCIEEGFNINEEFNNFTLLEKAVLNNKPDVVEFLLKNGADKSVVNICSPKFENFSLLSLIADSPDYEEVFQLLTRDDDHNIPLNGELNAEEDM